MDISIVAIAFGGYGRFLGQFLAYASNLNPKPKEVIVVLGKNHGCYDLALMECIYPGVRIVHYKKKPTFGKLRNIGISKASSEWIWYVDIDDKLERNAINTFKKVADEADYICAQWNTIGLGQPLELHKSPTPLEMAEKVKAGEKGGFIVPHSPFRKKMWEMSPYKNIDLSNYDFVYNCVLNGARFVKADKPTTTYLRRPDSHARAVLPGIKKKAVAEKRRMQQGMIDYYSDATRTDYLH